MKKVFTVLVVASFVSFTGCKNAPKNENCGANVEETTLFNEDEGDELIEEWVDEPAK